MIYSAYRHQNKSAQVATHTRYAISTAALALSRTEIVIDNVFVIPPTEVHVGSKEIPLIAIPTKYLFCYCG